MSELMDWLFDKTPSFADEAPPLPDHLSRLPPKKIYDDDPTTLGDIYELQPIFVGIDYTDAQGDHTRRRITTIKLVRGPNAPILLANCHERKAMRSFRTDRIANFIDMTAGEIHSTEAYFTEMFRIDLGLLAPKRITAPERPKCYEKLLAYVGVLVAIARSDNAFLSTELAVIERYIKTELRILGGYDQGAMGFSMSAIANMRPTKELLNNYLQIIHEKSRQRGLQMRFLDAVQGVVLADGHFSREERIALQEFGFEYGPID